jgi:hypothetical protein
MTFQIRHPLIENQYSSFNGSSAEVLPVSAGKLVKIVGETADGRALVDVVSDASADTIYGWLMQKVKDESAELPPGYRFRSDMGSSDAFIGDPVAVAMGPGAVYETDQYVDEGGDGIAAGTLLYCDDDGKLSDTNADSNLGGATAIALQSLTVAEAAAGKMLRIKALV